MCTLGGLDGHGPVGRGPFPSSQSLRLIGSPAFDPTRDAVPRSAVLDRTPVGLQIVMTNQPMNDEILAEFRAIGATMVGYLPERSFIVRVPDADAILELARLPATRWVGPYLPSYRLPPTLRREIESVALETRPPEGSARRYSILLFEAGPRAQQRIASLVSTLQGTVNLTQPNGRRMEATLSPDAVIALASADEVEFIDRWSPPEPDMDVVRGSTGADAIESLAGLTGHGVRGEVVDGGLLASHADFAARPPLIHRPGEDDTSHGTSAYGIVFGDGASDAQARGMLPDAQGIFSSNTGTFDRHQHTSELLEEPYRAVFQSNSWGGARTRLYTTVSADLDDIVFTLDLAILQSQSNAGNQDSRPEAWAKNVASVGGIRHLGTLSSSDDTWDYAGSTGPAIDGRIKPDVAHFADSIWTSDNASDTSHADFGGTSAATPIVAGCLGLIAQMWGQGMLGNTVSGGDVFDERPHESTLRALLINAARPYAFSSVADDMGRFRQGWGTPDVAWLLARSDQVLVVDHGPPLTLGQSASRAVRVDAGQTELRVTMVYPDPAGNPAAAISTVNDLSLRVTAPDGEVYWGNHGLLDGPWSTSGGESDAINTVENVLVQSPEPGVWLIEVIAVAISQDGWPGSTRLDATYSLVATGIAEALAPPMIVRFPDGVPDRIAPNRSETFEVEVIGPTRLIEVELILESGERYPLRTAPNHVARAGAHRLWATIPGVPCGVGELGFQIRAVSGGEETLSPLDAPATWHRVAVRDWRVVAAPDGDAGWSVTNIDLADGAWAWDSPTLGGTRGDPPTDADGDGACWLTGPSAINRDVDGGPTILTSPSLGAPGVRQGMLEAWVWLNCSDAGLPTEEDRLAIEFSTDDGASWTPLAEVRPTFHWRRLRVPLSLSGADHVRVRFVISDAGNNSPTEAAVDGVRLLDVGCSACPADLSGSTEPGEPLYGSPDGRADQIDLFYYLDLFAGASPAADLTGASDAADPGFGWPDGIVDATDLFYFLDLFSQGCQ